SADTDRTHDADNRNTLSVHPQRLAYNFPVAAIKLLPQLVAEYCREWRSRFVIFRREVTAEYRMHTQHFEVAVRHTRALHTHGAFHVFDGWVYVEVSGDGF